MKTNLAKSLTVFANYICKVSVWVLGVATIMYKIITAVPKAAELP